jgi:transcription termination factor Rho
MHLKELKKQSPADLVAMAEGLGVEGASTLRKQELMFSILKVQAENGQEIMGMGTIEVLPDGFGFLRSPDANYLAGRTTSMSHPIRFVSSVCAPAILSRARSADPRMANVISR